MHCLKCGTEIESPEVFCPDCLSQMQNHPVSRETPVILQPHPEFVPMRSRPIKPEEQISQLNRRMRKQRNLIYALGVVILVLCIALGVAFRFHESGPVIGQNYKTNIGSSTTTNVTTGSATSTNPTTPAE